MCDADPEASAAAFLQTRVSRAAQHDAGVVLAPTGPTPAVMEYADHAGSVCQGPLLDCVHIGGVPAVCYAERISYSMAGYEYGGQYFPEGFVFEGGKHLFRAMWACMLDPECGGFSVGPDNMCTYFYRPANFSWSAAPSSHPGWHCWEKRPASGTPAPEPDTLADSQAVSAIIDEKWNESLHALNATATEFDEARVKTQGQDYLVHDAQARLWSLAEGHAQRVEFMINDFGWAFVAPVAWTLTNGSAYINREYAEGKVHDYNQTLDDEVAMFQSNLSTSYVLGG